MNVLIEINKMKKILFIVGFSLLLQACGQKGPLYLPKNTQQSSQAAER